MPIGKEFSPEKEYAQTELIEHALKTLPEREEQVLRLRFFEGLTLQETAERLEISTRERVRQIQNVALRKLRYDKAISEDVRRLLEELPR